MRCDILLKIVIILRKETYLKNTETEERAYASEEKSRKDIIEGKNAVFEALRSFWPLPEREMFRLSVASLTSSTP